MNGSHQKTETNASNQHGRPLRDKHVLSALLIVFLRKRAVGKARTICSRLLTGEGAAVGLGTSLFRLRSHARSVLT